MRISVLMCVFKQKAAYEMRISDWSSDVCSSDLRGAEMKKRTIIAAGFAGLALGGCIQVKAPDKPIEINLNVKVQQEVVVRLQRDAQDLIQNNPELFPQ